MRKRCGGWRCIAQARATADQRQEINALLCHCFRLDSGVMRWLIAAPLREFVLLAAGSSLLLNLAMLVPSLFTLQVFDRVFASRSIDTLLMLSALTVVALGFAYWMDIARANALATAGRELHRALSAAMLERTMRERAAGRRHVEADPRRDVAQLAGFLGSAGARALFDAPWLPIYLLVIGVMHPLLGVAAAAGAVVLAVLAVITERATRGGTEIALQASRGTTRHADTLMRHAEVFFGMGMIHGVVQAWRDRHERSLDQQSRLAAVSAHLAALARVARQGVQLAVLGIGAWLVIDSGASPGIMIAATILLGRALQPVEYLIGGWKQLLDARSAWRRLAEPAIRMADDPRLRLPRPSGRLELERVIFGHDVAAPALIKSVSLSIEPGQSLGIVGASGSGKSTLARLMLGIWQPQGGVVRLDQANIAHWDRTDLGQHIGYLPQDVVLFPGTVAQNIARLGPVDDQEVIRAAELAQAHDLVLRLRNGYDTVVGEGDGALSGGQRQRIGLARALYRQPRLLVLDEPDAHLDADGEEALRKALQSLKACGTTVVCVGHRAGLMAQFDRIAVMKEGRLHAIGPAAAVLAALNGRNVVTLPMPADRKEATA
jgi:PrtD family type I secretion system ABC transporter